MKGLKRPHPSFPRTRARTERPYLQRMWDSTSSSPPQRTEGRGEGASQCGIHYWGWAEKSPEVGWGWNLLEKRSRCHQ